MSHELETRIIELEVRAAYQDQTIAALDEVVRTFADRVDELFAEITRLRQSVEEKAVDIGAPDEPPPHY
ncbi:MAG TPA: SlyX family protein [Kofleriaceae bacterium]|nr:SlyX family protein [Kofleriaceae bacterium]